MPYSDRAKFNEHAGFTDTKFAFASFSSASFLADSAFTKSKFNDHVDFGNCLFRGAGYFTDATFHRRADFRNATFLGVPDVADFTAIQVDRGFDMTGAKFSQVPSFNQADFKQPPDLDHVEFPLPWFLLPGKPELIAQYRAVRRLAIRAADYEREQLCFKGELRSRRWTTDKPWHAGAWLGLLYDGVSDCGRSVFRPLIAWLILLSAFSAIYLYNAGIQPFDWQGACAGSAVQKWEKSASLSLNSGVPLIGGSRTDEARLFAACLSQGTVDIPLSVIVLQVLETLASAALIFLLLLGIRNRYRIK